MTRSPSVRAGLAQRARIVLLAAEGVPNTEIAGRVGVARQTVLSWRARYARTGIAGLQDAPKSGRPPQIDPARIITETLTPPPRRLGVTQWSTRLLGSRLKVANSTIAKAWRAYGVQPRRAGAFRFSTVPKLEARAVDVVGLYLDPPQNAVVLCVDDTCQIKAREQTAPAPAMQPEPVDRRPDDDRRHLTRALFAALNDATGKTPRRRQDHHQEFLAFLRQAAHDHPDPAQELHLVLDNDPAHKHPAVTDWLAANPRVHAHVVPSHASWMNMVEIWLSMAERQAIHPDGHRFVRGLVAAIRAHIDGRNDRTHPFTWTRTAHPAPAGAAAYD